MKQLQVFGLINKDCKRWPALERHVGSGGLSIENNLNVNAIRPIAIGKKHWLFAGFEQAAHRAAAIKSLYATAEFNEFDPARWLAQALEKLPNCPNNRIDSLLPFAKSTMILPAIAVKLNIETSMPSSIYGSRSPG